MLGQHEDLDPGSVDAALDVGQERNVRIVRRDRLCSEIRVDAEFRDMLVLGSPDWANRETSSRVCHEGLGRSGDQTRLTMTATARQKTRTTATIVTIVLFIMVRTPKGCLRVL